MAMYSILVRNDSTTQQYFYLFQKQASFLPMLKASSNSLGCQLVGKYSNTGSNGQFDLDAQVYAGAISTMAPLPPSQINALVNISPSLAMVTSSVSAHQPVSLSGTQPKNFTIMTINPLGLSAPTNDASLQKGTFAIQVPIYIEIQPPNLYCGVAVIMEDGEIVLSSYVAPPPNQMLSCAQQSIYYIKVGYCPPGCLVVYDTSSSAECDFSSGLSSIMVTYNKDGTFTTKGMT